MGAEMRKPITDRDEVAPNIRRFAGELAGSQELQRRLGHVHAWYALQDEEGGSWMFAPSKFVGYPENTARQYLASARDDADGGRTEKALEAWFSPVVPGTGLERELVDALTGFLARWGRSPRRGARISVVSDGSPATRQRHDAEALLAERIAADPAIVGGRPHIRGTRMRVADIVEMIADGATRAEVLADFPYITDEDITAALAYAARAADHRVIRAA
jgi:uncharacterized protein (DUF433 family)